MSTIKPDILLVDDDPLTRRTLTAWLESGGYEVRCADDGQAAIAAIEAKPPHILITDCEMPQVSGLELCRWLRQRTLPHYVYTFTYSSHDNPGYFMAGFEAGADDVLRKPLHQPELLARVRAATRVIELESQLHHLAKCDPLTGLPTQRTLYEHLTREWSRSTRYHLPLTCIMVDIDYFKRINDTMGHPVGDEVIRRMGTTLSDSCRASDIVSRYGGEEFCMILPETDEQSAVAWAERVRETIADTVWPLDGKKIAITASFGVAQRLTDTQSPEELVDLADQALLVAKRSGRDRVVGFQSLNSSAEINSAATGLGAIFGDVRAGQVMTTIVAGLNENDLVGRAAQYFLRFRINSAPVVDEGGKLVGILAEKDVMSIMLGPNWWDTKIKDVMKSNVVCYEEDTPVLAIYEFLCRVSIRGVIIVRDGCPTGIISRGSLLRWCSNSRSVGTLGASADPTRDASMPKLSYDTPRHCLAQAAQVLAEEATEMQQRLLCDEVDIVPIVVGGASRMQELVNDLLAYSRYVNDDEDLADDDAQGGFGPLHQGLASALGESLGQSSEE